MKLETFASSSHPLKHIIKPGSSTPYDLRERIDAFSKALYTDKQTTTTNRYFQIKVKLSDGLVNSCHIVFYINNANKVICQFLFYLMPWAFLARKIGSNMKQTNI